MGDLLIFHPDDRARATALDRRGAERDPEDAERCRVLWAAVLVECLVSALEAKLWRLSAPGARRRPFSLTQGAPVGEGWIGGRDFHMVCALAGLDGKAVEDALAGHLASAAGIDRLLAALGKGPSARAERRRARG